jgi:Leu/Phe-tRNA-protein transferase
MNRAKAPSWINDPLLDFIVYLTIRALLHSVETHGKRSALLGKLQEFSH